MKLKKLLKCIPSYEVKGSREVEITGVCSDSRKIVPGNLFVAKRGRCIDGARFIPDAAASGASVALTDIYDPSVPSLTQVIVSDPTSFEALIAAAYHEFPSRGLLTVGITGTNGKTTTAYLVKTLLDSLVGPCGLIGTIEYVIGEHSYRASHTTPDASTSQKLLKEMVNIGCKAAVMEVSSHALEQGRVGQIEFDLAVFTNLSREHLDYHGTMENYCRAKSRLFASLDPRRVKGRFPSPKAVINADDEYAKEMMRACSTDCVTYGIFADCDLRAEEIKFTSTKTQFFMCCKGERTKIIAPLIGRHNVYNLLAAAASLKALGYPLERIAEILEKVSSIPGRLEPVPNPLGLRIYVDFAHTPEALKNVLACVKELRRGKTITVFGCGGDRDREKRPLMAEASETFSDFTVVTSDNPRGEEPEAIIAEIIKGFSKNSYVVEPDRERAIERAVQMAGKEDVVLIAGKGHEAMQIFSRGAVEFDDRKRASEVCRRLNKEGMEKKR